MSALPKVAVIIATHNYKQYLPDAMRSVVDQDYPDITTVVIDDGSTDGTHELLLQKAAEPTSQDEEKEVFDFERDGSLPLVYIRLRRKSGPSRARNVGIQYVWDKTHLFQILDADDMMLPNKVSKCVARLMTDPERIGGVYADYLHKYEATGSYAYESKEPYSYERLVQDCIVHSGSLISKLALTKSGPYLEQLTTCEDMNLWLRIANFFIFSHIAEPLSIVRVTGHNSSDYISQEQWNRNYAMAKQHALGHLRQQ